MLQLTNHTPFAAQLALFPNEQGVDTLYVVVKGSFDIGDNITLCDLQSPPQMQDEYYGEPGASSVKYSSDVHPGKVATDIFMIGQACAPDQRPVYFLDVHLQVGKLAKIVRVFGNRVWQGGSISQPEAFTRMPLVYEKAFGGLDLVDGQVRAGESRNPVGVGFAGKKTSSQIDGTPLPNLECPKSPITHPNDTPEPACFAPRAPNWYPRLLYAGTYDEQWEQQRAPYLPADYSARFMNAAHPDLIAEGFLQGGEPVKIMGMHPLGELNFTVPYVKLAAEIDLADKKESLLFNLESILLEPNQLKVSLVWKAAFPCDKQALKIRQVTLNLAR